MTIASVVKTLGVLLAGAVAGLLLRGLWDHGHAHSHAHEHSASTPSTEATGGESASAQPSQAIAQRMLKTVAGIEGVTDLANETCPIMDNTVPEGSAVFLVYNGLIVHFCCPGCDRRFLENPLEHLQAMAAAGVAVPEDQLLEAAHPPVVRSGNSACPIMGKPPVSGLLNSVVHRGVHLKFCCPPCLPRFLRDPDVALREVAKTGTVPPERLP